jgi:hypothetical protein
VTLSQPPEPALAEPLPAEPVPGSVVPEFTTRPRTETETGENAPPPPYVFRLDGVTMEAHRPKDALVAQLAPVQSRRTPPMRKIQLALDFLEDCVAEPGKTVLRSRLLDPDDDLDVDDVMPILHGIGDHWKAHQQALARR